mmetsp:Transcript_10658/g.30808  ORF Transcript_10658/g.30808 Transcript_10658/m.30808 type:complete len:344 (-) Transcript_10658:672-1703(-)
MRATPLPCTANSMANGLSHISSCALFPQACRCEHSYEHKWCHDAHIKWRVTSYVIRFMFFLMTGTSVGYSQWVGRVEQVKRGHHILCKSTAAMPYINKPHKKASWRRFFWWWAEPDVDREVTSRRAPVRIAGSTVTFVDGSSADFDVIVLATGYTQRFPFLPARRAPGCVDGLPLADPRGGASNPRGAEDSLPSDHYIIDPSEPRLAYLGFVRPNVGAIPPMAELQCLWWIARLRGLIPAERDPPSYGLLGKKLSYGVDYGNYMHQLAAEFGGAPTLSQLVHKPRVLIAYCLGQVRLSSRDHCRLRQGPSLQSLKRFRPSGLWALSRSSVYDDRSARAPCRRM